MVSEESLADSHKERIYRALESEIKAREPGLQLIFNGIVDWSWIGEDYCLFLNSSSLTALSVRAGSPLAQFVYDFASRHGLNMQFRVVDNERFGMHSPYRQGARR
jgi:hypothetical protein